MIRVHRLNFDCHFKIGFCVNGLVNFSKSTLVNFTDDLEVFTNLLQHLRHGFSINLIDYIQKLFDNVLT